MRGRAVKLDGILFGKAEVDEEFPVVDFQGELLGLHRRLERQHEVQGQHRFLLVEIEIVTRRRIVEFQLLAVGGGVGEVVVFLERGDVDFGERRQLLAGELALLLRLDALGREHREHVIEGPGVAHPGHGAIGRIDELALHGHPDVRVRAGHSARNHDTGECGQVGKDKTADHGFARQARRSCATISGTAAEWRREALPDDMTDR